MLALILSVLTLLGTGSAVPLPVQQDRGGGQYTVAVDVDLILFNISVTDSRGEQVGGLTQNDFRVTEDGHPQKITLFRAEDVPASIGLIIDNSGSMRTRSAEVAEAALGFVNASNSDDELFTINFNEKVYLGLPDSILFSHDMNQLRSALLRNAASGLTALYDALSTGLEHLKLSRRDRKALVALSDGGDNASHCKLDDVVRLAHESSATIYTIGLYEVENPDRNPGALRRISSRSGGRAFFPKSPKELQRAWLDIASGIRSQYTIGFTSTNAMRDGTFRKVRIAASQNGKGLTVQTREGYMAPGK